MPVPPESEHGSVSSPSLGGAVMKLVNSLKKKFKGEKSLKAYAWYIWY
ncbi:tryptorubin family RiPP precursor [Streptomyces sp. NPDC018045]